MSFGQNDTFEAMITNDHNQKVEYSLSPYSPSKTDDLPVPQSSPIILDYNDFEMVEN